jgi:hypothetical protein
MRLEGKVVGPWVEECRRAWGTLQTELGSKKLCLDMRGVTYVDDIGTRLLQEIHRMTGAKVLADSPLTKYFAERIMRAVELNGTEGV